MIRQQEKRTSKVNNELFKLTNSSFLNYFFYMADDIFTKKELPVTVTQEEKGI